MKHESPLKKAKKPQTEFITIRLNSIKEKQLTC